MSPITVPGGNSELFRILDVFSYLYTCIVVNIYIYLYCKPALFDAVRTQILMYIYCIYGRNGCRNTHYTCSVVYILYSSPRASIYFMSV